MSDHSITPQRRSSWQPMAVSVTDDGVTTVHVHGPAGPGTMIDLREPQGVQRFIPSATIVNVHPDDRVVAWDGEQFVMCEGITEVVQSANLAFVAQVVPVEMLEPTASELYKQGSTEVDRRRKLLDDYKAATGNPSNKQIYEAQNSGIYKPQFYEWRDGRLPRSSATPANFERFLHEKKRPIKGGR
jgi:hypothetical protein